MDLSEEFVKISREDDWLILESNKPNDTIGDFAFEWDLDGSQRKAWLEKLEEYEKNGTLGDIVYTRMELRYLPELDDSNIVFEGKKSSAEFLIFDVNE